jgi:hypothetical protein
VWKAPAAQAKLMFKPTIAWPPLTDDAKPLAVFDWPPLTDE